MAHEGTPERKQPSLRGHNGMTALGKIKKYWGALPNLSASPNASLMGLFNLRVRRLQLAGHRRAALLDFAHSGNLVPGNWIADGAWDKVRDAAAGAAKIVARIRGR